MAIDSEHLLQQALIAAEAGQKVRARDLLLQVLRLDKANIEAWLALKGLLDKVEAQIECLEQALLVNPDDETLQDALHEAHALKANEYTRSAFDAIEVGDDERARELLSQAVAEDESNPEAWLWLGQVSETYEEQEICFENVLVLDPGNVEARRALDGIRRGRELLETQQSPLYYDHTPDEPVDETPSDGGTTSPDAAPSSQQMYAPTVNPSREQDLHDDMQCPYCAALTLYEDQRCSQCGHLLWNRSRAVAKIRPTYWLLLVLEGLILLGGGLLPLLLLDFVVYQLDIDQIGALLPVYFRRTTLPPDETALVFGIVPPILFWLALLPSILAVLILICVASRWQPLFFAAAVLDGVRGFLLLCGLGMVLLGQLGIVSASGEIQRTGEVPGIVHKSMQFSIGAGYGVGLVLSLVSFSFLMNVMDHFAINEERLLLRPDRDIEPSALSYWLRGREYTKQRKWAIAALHLRQSLMLEERFEAYAQLAVSYAHLGYADKVAITLRDAKRFSPNHPQLEQLEDLLINSMSELEA